MTIRKGAEWGHSVARPPGLQIVHGDAELAAALTDGHRTPTAVARGDLFRTLGEADVSARSQLQELDLDLLRLRLDDGSTATAVAHVVARNPLRAGSWWRGRVLFVMNAQFHGVWDVAPRSHPNDGRADVVDVDAALGARQRWMASRRARTAQHLPHPALSTSRITESSWSFERPLSVFADGVEVGRSRTLQVRVEPDGGRLYA